MSKKPIGYILIHDSTGIKEELESLKEEDYNLYRKLKETFHRVGTTLESFDVFLLKGRKHKSLKREIQARLCQLNCSTAKELLKKIGRKYRYIGSEDFNHSHWINASLKNYLTELNQLGFKRVDM